MTVTTSLNVSLFELYNELAAARKHIADLEAQLSAVTKWTRITDDPATWPPLEVEHLVGWQGRESSWHFAVHYDISHRLHRFSTGMYWMPITPPQIEP